MRLHSSFRLRRWLPWLVVGPVVLMLLVTAVWQDWQAMNDAETAVVKQLKQRVTDERFQIEYLLRRDDHTYLAEQIVQFGAVPEMLKVVLVDERGVVRYATQDLWLGKRLSEAFPEYDDVHFQAAQAEGRLRLEFDAARQYLTACQPVFFPKPTSQSEFSKPGALVLKYDFGPAKNQGRRRVITSTLVEIGFALALVFVLVAILRRSFSWPMLHLEALLNRISQGDFFTEIEVTGQGELAKLGRVVAHMQSNLAASNEARDAHVAALRDSEARFRVLFEQAAIGVALIDSISGRFVRVNKCYCDLVAFSEAELLEANYQAISHPEELKTDLENMRRLVAGELREFVMEKRLYRKDGSVIWVLLTVSPTWAPGATPNFHIAVVQDITKRRETEIALRESEKRYATVLSVLFEGVVCQGRNDEILTWNPAAERILGLSGEQLQGRTSRDPRWRSVNAEGGSLAAEDHPSMVVLRTGVPQLGVELGVHKPDGTLTWLSVNAVPVFDGENKLPASVVVSFADVSERKRAQDAVRRSERFLKTIIETEPECVKIVNAKGELLEMNAAGLAMLEADSVEQVEKVGLGGFILPEYRGRFASLHSQVMAGASGLLEFEVLGLKGTRRWLETHAAPLRDDSGRVGLLLGITRDITVRKKAEDALRVSLEEKEALLREVHHRVKNNLQVIVSLLRMEGGRNVDSGTKCVLKEMQARVQSMALLHELLYSAGSFAAVDLGEYIRHVVTHIFRAVVTKTGLIELRLELASVSVKMDQALPCGLLVNELLSNCFKHAFPNDRSGEIRVAVSYDPAKSLVCLSVRDDGIGLPMDFNPVTGKTLGLQLVSDLTRQLNGELVVSTERGAEFAVTFAR